MRDHHHQHPRGGAAAALPGHAVAHLPLSAPGDKVSVSKGRCSISDKVDREDDTRHDSSSPRDEEHTTTACSICLESLSTFSPSSKSVMIGAAMPCGHVFHSDCFDALVQNSDSCDNLVKCPLCQQGVYRFCRFWLTLDNRNLKTSICCHRQPTLSSPQTSPLNQHDLAQQQQPGTIAVSNPLEDLLQQLRQQPLDERRILAVLDQLAALVHSQHPRAREHRSAIGLLGGVTLLLDLLDTNQQGETVLEQHQPLVIKRATAILGNLTLRNSDNQLVAKADPRCIQLLTRTLQRNNNYNSTAIQIARNVLVVLGSLLVLSSSSSSSPFLDGTPTRTLEETVCHTLDAHMDDALVQEYGCCVLFLLTKTKQQSQQQSPDFEQPQDDDNNDPQVMSNPSDNSSCKAVVQRALDCHANNPHVCEWARLAWNHLHD